MTTVTQLGGLTSGTATTIQMTVGADVPIGSTVVVLVETVTVAATPSAVNDSQGNTYVPGTALNALGILMRPFWCIGTTGALANGVDTITAAFPVGATAMLIGAIAIDKTLALDVQGAGVTASNTTPSISSGALVQANEIAIAIGEIGAGASDTFTEASGWTSNTPQLFTAALRWAYQPTSSTAGVTYAPTLGTARRYYYNILTFTLPVATPAPAMAFLPPSLARDVALNAQALASGGAPRGLVAPAQQLDWPAAQRPDPRVAVGAQEWMQGNPPTGFTPPVAQLDWPTPPRPPVFAAITAQSAELGRPPSGFLPINDQPDWPVFVRPVGLLALYSQFWMKAPPRAGFRPQVGGFTELPPLRPDPRVAVQAQRWVVGAHPSAFRPLVFQPDWPNPLRPFPLVAVIAGILGGPPGAFTPPVSLPDWPVPLRPYARTDQQLGNPPVAATPAPFQPDWPTPPRAFPVVAIDSQSWIEGSPPGAFTPLVQQPDWPVAPRPYQVVQPSFQAATFLVPVAAPTPPPFQGDWPVFLRPYPKVEVSWSRPPGAFTPAVSQPDWPVPLRPHPTAAINAQGWIVCRPPSGFLALVFQADWPTPPRPYQRAHYQLGNIPGRFIPPTNQGDWPTPPRPYPRVDFLFTPPLLTIIPIAQPDAPNPLRAPVFSAIESQFRVTGSAPAMALTVFPSNFPNPIRPWWGITDPVSGPLALLSAILIARATPTDQALTGTLPIDSALTKLSPIDTTLTIATPKDI